MERFDPDEHLETPSAREARRVLLAGDLGIALGEEAQPELLLDHGFEELADLGIPVEGVRRAPYLPSGDLDHRAEIAGVGASACRVDAEHARSTGAG